MRRKHGNPHPLNDQKTPFFEKPLCPFEGGLHLAPFCYGTLKVSFLVTIKSRSSSLSSSGEKGIELPLYWWYDQYVESVELITGTLVGSLELSIGTLVGSLEYGRN